MPGKVQRRTYLQRERCLWGIVATLALGACGAAKKPAHTQAAAVEYDAVQSTLFGDLFRQELFGLESALGPERDGLLPDRTRVADTVVPARVVTISRETRGATQSYSVVLAPTELALVGPTPSAPLTYTIVATSPVYGWLEGVGDRWVGTRLLLFRRVFRSGDHFYATVDRPTIRELVKNAKQVQTNQSLKKSASGPTLTPKQSPP